MCIRDRNKTSKKTQLPKASLGCWKGCVKLKSTNVKNGQFSHWGFAGVPNCSFLSGPARPSLRFMQTESQARDALKASLIRTWRYDQLKHKPSHENSLALPRTTNFYCQANWRNYWSISLELLELWCGKAMLSCVNSHGVLSLQTFAVE